MAAPLTRNLTILFTDIQGFADRSSSRTRAETQQLLDKHREIVLPILQGKGGALVKTIGDAFLMTFESPTDAVLAGVGAQEALRAYNASQGPDTRIRIRVSINQGEVNLSEGDVYGEAVNITARILAVAEADEVFFTNAVYLAMNKKEVPSSEVGLLQLKGIPEKVRVYKVKRETPVSGSSARSESHSEETKAPPGLPVSATGKPTSWMRFGALCLDGFLVAIISGHLHIVGFTIGWILYQALVPRWLGTTVGGKVCRLAVAPYSPSVPLEHGHLWLRAVFSLVSGWAAGLGYFWALWEKDGRGWHDLVAGTKVVALD